MNPKILTTDPIISSLPCVMCITDTAAKISNYITIIDLRANMDNIYADTDLSKYTNVAKLCKEIGTNSLDIDLDDTVFLGIRVPDRCVGHKGHILNIHKILEAKDAKAMYNEIEAH